MIASTRRLTCILLLGFLSACGSGTPEKAPYTGVKIGKPYEVYGRWYKPQYDSHYDEIGMASWYGPGFHGGHTANGERFDQDSLTAAHRTLPMPSIVRVTNLDNGLSALVKVNDRGPFARDRIIDLSRGAAKKLGVIRTGTARVRVQFLEKETQEYVQNLQSGTQYAMRQVKTVDPQEAGEREEAGAKPTLKIETKMFDNAPATPPASSVFAAVDDDKVVSRDVQAQPMLTPASFQAPPKSRSPGGLTSPSNTGFFIQAGTFNVEQNAYDLVDKVPEGETPQIMEVFINGKKFYRVMMGPYEDQKGAKNMLSKLASMGISNAKLIHN